MIERRPAKFFFIHWESEFLVHPESQKVQHPILTYKSLQLCRTLQGGSKGAGLRNLLVQSVAFDKS